MELTVQIPDEVATQLGGESAHLQLERRALEAFALAEFRARRINKVQLGEMLGLGRTARDGFFKEHGVYDEYTLEDFESERRALQELGI